MNKVCSKCKSLKQLGDFHLDKAKLDGRRTICKLCVYYNNRLYRQCNLEKVKERDRNWSIKNRLYANERYRKRYQTSVLVKLKKNLRNRLVVAVKSNYRNTSAVSDLGCSIEFFKQYLEAKFEVGMTWDNWGRIDSSYKSWNIDHIKPLSSVTSEEELRKLVHYTNLTPLWALDNIIKGIKNE